METFYIEPQLFIFDQECFLFTLVLLLTGVIPIYSYASRNRSYSYLLSCFSWQGWFLFTLMLLVAGVIPIYSHAPRDWSVKWIASYSKPGSSLVALSNIQWLYWPGLTMKLCSELHLNLHDDKYILS